VRAALIALLLGALIVPVVPAAATHSPATSSPSILTSAFPDIYSNDSFAYVLSSSEAANWSCAKCPYSHLLVANPSFYAALSSSTGLPYNGSQTFSIAAQMGATTFYQNWTPTTLNGPTVPSLPSFTVNVGTYYEYTPSVVNPGTGGTWHFTGAPYLSLNSGTGEVSGTPLNTTVYTNTLTYTSSLGSWIQSWVTAPSTGVFPATLTFSGSTLGHSVTATLPTTAVAGLGEGLVWLGSHPLIGLGTGSDGYSFSYTGPWSYTLDWQSGTTTNKNLTFYGAPLSTPAVTVNGHALTEAPFLSRGYNNTTLTPPPKVTGLSVTSTSPLSITVGWSNPVGAVADNLYYGTTCGAWLKQVNLTLVTSDTVTSLAPTTTYCIAVGAVSLAGQGPLAYTNGTTDPLPKATDLVGNVYGSFVALTWGIPVGVNYTKSVVYFGTACGSWGQTFQIQWPVDDLNVSQLPGSYCVGVILYAGYYYSPTTFTNVTVSPINPPAAPVNVRATGIGSLNFTARWNVTARATSYEVLYGLICGSYPYRLAAGNHTYANVTGLSPITTYCLVVEAFNGTSGGPYSVTVMVTTNATSSPSPTPPPTPTPNPNPSPSPSVITVINLFWTGVIVLGAVVVALLVGWFNRRRRGR